MKSTSHRFKNENLALGNHCRDSVLSDKSRILRKGLGHYCPDNSLRPLLENHNFSSQTLESNNDVTDFSTRESKQNAQTLIASQGVKPKRSEIIFRLKNSKICKFIGKFERRRGILPRLPKRKSGGFCLFGVGGVRGGNPFSFCDNKPCKEKSKEAKNNKSDTSINEKALNASHSRNDEQAKNKLTDFYPKAESTSKPNLSKENK